MICTTFRYYLFIVNDLYSNELHAYWMINKQVSFEKLKNRNGQIFRYTRYVKTYYGTVAPTSFDDRTLPPPSIATIFYIGRWDVDATITLEQNRRRTVKNDF